MAVLGVHHHTAEDIPANAAGIKQLERSDVDADPVASRTAAEPILQTASRLLTESHGVADARRRPSESHIEAAIADLLSPIATAAGPGELAAATNNVIRPVLNPAVGARAN